MTTLVWATAITIAVLVVLGLARSATRRRDAREEPGLGPPPPEVRVLRRVSCGVGRTLCVIEVEGRRFLLGSTWSQWTALADLGADPAPGDPYAQIDSELKHALDSSRFPRRRGRRL